MAGGLAATLPASADFENPETGGLLKKYLAGATGSTMDRFKVLNTLKFIISFLNALLTTGMIHAEGSIEASTIELFRSYDYSDDEALAKYASGITDTLSNEK
jgi:4-hydroxybutyryl-CoA dehydratase/vinylacetyl-CoA-Delta-isomerase